MISYKIGAMMGFWEDFLENDNVQQSGNDNDDISIRMWTMLKIYSKMPPFSFFKMETGNFVIIDFWHQH